MGLICNFGIARRLSTCTTRSVVWQNNFKWYAPRCPCLKVREGNNSQCQLTLIYDQLCPFPYHKNMNGGQQDLRSALETTPAKRGHCLGWCGHCWCKIGLQNKHIPSSHYNKSIISSSILDNYERFGIYIEFSSDLDQADFCSSNRLDLGSKNVKALLTHIIKKK